MSVLDLISIWRSISISLSLSLSLSPSVRAILRKVARVNSGGSLHAILPCWL